jgi:FkbM family methyltransferase
MQSKFEKIKEIKKNITLIDFLLSPFTLFRQNLYDLFVIRKVIKNWPDVLLFRLGLKKKFIMELRNGKKVKIEKPNNYFNFWNSFWSSKECLIFLSKDVKFDKKKKLVKFKYKNHLIQLYPQGELSLIKGQFIDEEYRWLNVKGKEVVDVGANIGDTAIYFALNGAKQVYAFEPYPFSYKIALKNIRLNKLEKKVTLLNEAIGKENKTICIDGNYKNTGSDDLKEFKRGKKIKVTTLEEIVKRFKLKDAVLKIDCEGCEYPTLLNTPNEVLRNFEQIMIEYHYGYLNLKKKLEEAGFKVKASLPKYYFNNRAQNPHTLVGYLYAQRLSKAQS